VTKDQAELFEILQALSEHLVAQRWDEAAQLGVTERPFLEMCEDHWFPLTANDF